MAGGIWVIGEVDGAGALTKLSGEAATAARALGEAGGREVVGVVVAGAPDAAAASQTTAPVAAPAAAPVPAPKTMEEKLRELAALRDARLITPEDYEAKKTAILATM